jgi:hypothetical protein
MDGGHVAYGEPRKRKRYEALYAYFNDIPRDQGAQQVEA